MTTLDSTQIPDWLLDLSESSELECKKAAGKDGKGQIPLDMWPTISGHRRAAVYYLTGQNLPTPGQVFGNTGLASVAAANDVVPSIVPGAGSEGLTASSVDNRVVFINSSEGLTASSVDNRVVLINSSEGLTASSVDNGVVFISSSEDLAASSVDNGVVLMGSSDGFTSTTVKNSRNQQGYKASPDEGCSAEQAGII